MNAESLINLTEAYVRKLYADTDKDLYYHNFEHAEHAVKAADKIAKHYQLNEEDYLVVLLAAWLHDVGYLVVGRSNHEESSAAMAETFLTEQQASTAVITKVKQCILATKMPQAPTNLLEEIICDADLYDLGTEHFKNNNKKVRKEVEILLGKELTGAEWRAHSLMFLKKQIYKTEYCRKYLQEGIQNNIKAIEEKQAEKGDRMNITKESSKEEKNKEKAKVERGVETMFRTTSTNHLRLSEMADNKANIMITVEAVK